MKTWNETAISRRGFVCGLGLVTLGLAGCGSGANETADATSTNAAPADKPEDKPVEEPKTSDDPHIAYIKNYVGLNAANLGYEALNGFRMDRLGPGYLRLVLVDPTGVYVDPADEDQLKGYVVFDQNLPMNTQVNFEMMLNEAGEEMLTMPVWQSHDEVVLAVRPVGNKDLKAVDMTPIDAAPDRYTAFVRDYVGRNLAECGYTALNGNLTDSYGIAYVKLALVAEDGAYVDPNDKAALAGYVVTAQDVAPNTKIVMEPHTMANGEVYDRMVGSQSIDSVTLSLRALETAEG